MKDWRKPQGKRYSLPALLVLALTGLLCRKRGPTALSHGCHGLPGEVLQALGVKPEHRPSPAMFCRLFWRLAVADVEQGCRAWCEVVHARLAPRLERAGQLDCEAIDGKTVRRAAREGAQDTHLLSALRHHLKLVPGQVAVDDKTNEIGATLRVSARRSACRSCWCWCSRGASLRWMPCSRSARWPKPSWTGTGTM